MKGHAFAGAGGESFGDLRHRWLDALLFGRNNGLWAEPRVLVEDSTGRWHESNDWPLDGSSRVVLSPAANGSLLRHAPKAGRVSYEDILQTDRGYFENGGSAIFRSAPLSSTRLVNGAPEVKLVASSDQTMTKWVAYLLAEAPDGTWERISHGYADSHSWGKEDRWLEMEPGNAYTWKLKLLPSAVVVPRGHRVVLVIASQDDAPYPISQSRCFSDYNGGCYDPTGIRPSPTAGRATNTVLTGRNKTEVRFDWVDPRKTAKPPWGPRG